MNKDRQQRISRCLTELAQGVGDSPAIPDLDMTPAQFIQQHGKALDRALGPSGDISHGEFKSAMRDILNQSTRSFSL